MCVCVCGWVGGGWWGEGEREAGEGRAATDPVYLPRRFIKGAALGEIRRLAIVITVVVPRNWRITCGPKGLRILALRLPTRPHFRRLDPHKGSGGFALVLVFCGW